MRHLRASLAAARVGRLRTDAVTQPTEPKSRETDTIMARLSWV
jgi:hypothetical protein